MPNYLNYQSANASFTTYFPVYQLVVSAGTQPVTDQWWWPDSTNCVNYVGAAYANFIAQTMMAQPMGQQMGQAAANESYWNIPEVPHPIPRRPAGIALINRERAKRRAQSLFLSHLTDEQRREFDTHNHITIRTPSGRVVRINHGMVGNVDVFDVAGRRKTMRLCAHPDGVPVFDTMLAQLLHLRDPELEQEFFRIANRLPVIAA